MLFFAVCYLLCLLTHNLCSKWWDNKHILYKLRHLGVLLTQFFIKKQSKMASCTQSKHERLQGTMWGGGFRKNKKFTVPLLFSWLEVVLSVSPSPRSVVNENISYEPFSAEKSQRWEPSFSFTLCIIRHCHGVRNAAVMGVNTKKRSGFLFHGRSLETCGEGGLTTIWSAANAPPSH